MNRVAKIAMLYPLFVSTAWITVPDSSALQDFATPFRVVYRCLMGTILSKKCRAPADTVS